MNIEKNILEFYSVLMKHKNFFWEHPEGAYKEFETSEYIVQELEKIGYKEIYKNVNKTGVVAVLRGKNEHPCLGLRADIDAVQMEKDKYKHTCGHDAHMAILLTLAEILYNQKENINGTIKFIFQPAEEDINGAKNMINEGVLKNPEVDKIFALHVWSELPKGTIAIKSGPTMASTDPIDITITGKGGHAAIPEKCINPITCVPKIMEEFQNISNQYNKEEQKIVLGITAIHAGNNNNVIPSKLKIKGIFRTFDNEIREVIKTKLQKISKNISQDTGCQIELTHQDGLPVLINSIEEANQIQNIASKIVGQENVVKDYQTMCSEDFSYYLEKVPGTFIFIGCMQDIYYPQHNENFKVDENSIILGLQLMHAIVKWYTF